MNLFKTLAMVGLVGVGMAYGQDAPKKKVVVDESPTKGWTYPLSIGEMESSHFLMDLPLSFFTRMGNSNHSPLESAVAP